MQLKIAKSAQGRKKMCVQNGIFRCLELVQILNGHNFSPDDRTGRSLILKISQ